MGSKRLHVRRRGEFVQPADEDAVTTEQILEAEKVKDEVEAGRKLPVDQVERLAYLTHLNAVMNGSVAQQTKAVAALERSAYAEIIDELARNDKRLKGSLRKVRKLEKAAEQREVEIRKLKRALAKAEKAQPKKTTTPDSPDAEEQAQELRKKFGLA